MATVVDKSGNNPGNPNTNNWTGIDAHLETLNELQRDYFASGGASDFSRTLFVLVNAGAWRSALATNNAANLTTGVLDPARIPVITSAIQVISSGDLTALTAPQQSQIVAGAIVTTTDGNRWIYTGSGSKTLSTSYIQLADITPDWSVIANKPSWTTALTTNAPSALANSQNGTIGTGTAAAKDDHQHPYPLATVNTQTGTSYTLQSSDHGLTVELNNASPITLTVPSLFAGFNCSIAQIGAGQVTIVAGSGMTFRNSGNSTKTRAQWSEVAIRIRPGNTEFIASGDMA
ncbi:MAG: hypothetical protein IM561_09160 [Microcystis sp. M60BS1]|uniref:hypothetical protein n=1 Tax=unclassified Microcystis TaxID=2643300 RepID=UPI00258015DD|nr:MULTISPECIES: hypothetical protein [unclassified Microcystis]MCA2594391.1 hypothetical protein [Microcystis sp. M38BS1]MCA6581485.1 hypothetical protein [Pseudanabaena sp. M34BS1SP1A06MG]MCA2510538.1 hypothetical protein [Microcystis sp. M60BS1]MCA2555772.1 hypothetical protein [Microcystis sp. M43BS1]MCA2593154.1 hypothetical protein [Microcystis sp. M31BS1]